MIKSEFFSNFSFEGKYYTAAQRANCDFAKTSVVNVGVFYNDVWAYR